jgi:hypothetical protein
MEEFKDLHEDSQSLLQRNYHHKNLDLKISPSLKDVNFSSMLDFTLLTDFKGFFCLDLSELCFKSIH